MREIFGEHQVEKFAFDAWHFATFREALGRAGFPPQLIEQRFVEAPQTFKWMSPAVRSLETVIMDGKLRHGANPVLTWCMSNVAIERNAAGERKFNKRGSAGRIDGAVALLMTVGAAPGPATTLLYEAANVMLTHARDGVEFSLADPDLDLGLPHLITSACQN